MKTVAEFLAERWRNPARCEACGRGFTCGATLTGCWCSEIKLSDETRAQLRSRYSGCLCRQCLENMARGTKEVLGRTVPSA